VAAGGWVGGKEHITGMKHRQGRSWKPPAGAQHSMAHTCPCPTCFSPSPPPPPCSCPFLLSLPSEPASLSYCPSLFHPSPSCSPSRPTSPMMTTSTGTWAWRWRRWGGTRRRRRRWGQWPPTNTGGVGWGGVGSLARWGGVGGYVGKCGGDGLPGSRAFLPIVPVKIHDRECER
jgi:hypothetical protein